MADFLARPAGLGPPDPDGYRRPPRQTATTTDGHQIRLTDDPGRRGLRVTCTCQDGRTAPWAVPVPYTGDGHWKVFNDIPHDPAAGPFTPLDETTGRASGHRPRPRQPARTATVRTHPDVTCHHARGTTPVATRPPERLGVAPNAEPFPCSRRSPPVARYRGPG